MTNSPWVPAHHESQDCPNATHARLLGHEKETCRARTRQGGVNVHVTGAKDASRVVPNDSRKGFGEGKAILPVGELIFSERSASAAMNDGPTEMSTDRDE